MDSGERDSIRLLFEDTDKAVAIRADQDFVEPFKKIIPDWPFQVLSGDEDGIENSLLVEGTTSGYLVSSIFTETTKEIRNPVDVVCEIIAELAWATIDANPEWLCLHCAACQIGDGLVLFPNKRRVGKSTLSTVLGLKGIPIFTDDFLAIAVDTDNQLSGIASGVSARMRMPWPRNLSPQMSGMLEKSMIASSKAYSYHINPGVMPLRRGLRAPIRSLVLLNRDEEYEKASLESIAKEAVLIAIIIQNFARARNAERILAILHFLASNIETYKLNYSSAEDAADTVIDFFSRTKMMKSPPLPDTLLSLHSDTLPIQPDKNVTFDPGALITQSGAISSYEVEGTVFLADENGYGIHKLDPIGSAIWKLMADPIAVSEIEATLIAAFPDAPADEIKADIRTLIQRFFQLGVANGANGEKDTCCI